MPSSVASAALLFGIVLALAGSPTAAVLSGAIGAAFELYLFWNSGVR